MKKLIKHYNNLDPKLANLQFGNYGTLIKILETIVCGQGFNPIDISKIEKHATKKEVTFTFKVSGNYNHKVGEVVNLQDNESQEYVIVEITNEFLRCEYYDEYTIASNTSYTGKIVNSSIGFKKESGDANKIVISDEYKVAKYYFFDVNDPNGGNSFIDSDFNKVAWMYMESYDNPQIKAPLMKSGTDYNNTGRWTAFGGSTDSYRRGVMNLTWRNNQNYTIIGNGNFFYFITGLDGAGLKYTPYVFGTFKKYIEADNYNAIIASKPIVNSNYTIKEDIYVLNVASTYNRDMFNYNPNTLLQTPIGEANIANGTVSQSSSNYTICDINVNQQILSGMSSGPSAFALTPATFFGISGQGVKSGVSDYAYPNNSNKMYLSEVNINSGTNTSTKTVTLRGKMPFAFWYGHPIATAPAHNTIYNINDNGNIRKFYVYNNSTGPSIAFIEVTPNGYDNYYLE